MPELNLTRYCLEAHVARTPDGPALRFLFDDGSVAEWTYAEVFGAIEQQASTMLAAGLVPGDRVMVCLDHSPEYAFAFFGAALAGLVPIPVSPALTQEELDFLAADSGASAAIVDGVRVPAGPGVMLECGGLSEQVGHARLPSTDAEDPAFLIYTSGTTARPKGVLHAHRTVFGRALMRDSWQGFGPGDVVMHAGALNWSYTLGVGLMDAWAAGATAVLGERPANPGAWLERIRDQGVNVFVGVPTVYRQALKYGDPSASLPALRHVLCAGEPLPPALLDEWRGRFGVEMYESLGMTEISTYISSGPTTPVRPGSPGRPQPGRKVVILPADSDATSPLPPGATGMLAVSRDDPGLMLGYWNRPEEERAVYRGEWFAGGDLASIDSDGYVWFHGRSDDIIKSFGYRLSPVEIEAVIEGHPAVAEAAVVGRTVDEQKTLVVAFVVPTAGRSLDTDEVSAHVRAHLAEYKQPHEYRLVNALPRTPNGKLQRSRLQAHATQ